jgi:hypothetical protein
MEEYVEEVEKVIYCNVLYAFTNITMNMNKEQLISKYEHE